jgi:four helix bundle protein
VSDFKKLKVWQKAHALALHTYRVATKMPRARDLSLRGQLIRAAISIPANIVEVDGRTAKKSLRGFCESHSTPPASSSII